MVSRLPRFGGAFRRVRHFGPHLCLIVTVLVTTHSQPVWAGEVMERIASEKVLRLGARTDAPPFAFENNGGLSGFTTELCVAVGQALSRETGLEDLQGNLVPVNAENRFDMLQKGEIDVLCGATTATLARREMVSFSIPTFVTGIGSITREDAPALMREVLIENSPASASEVVIREALQGKRLGVRRGTTANDWLSEAGFGEIDGVETVLLDDHFEGIEQVADGRIDAYFADHAILVGLIQSTKTTTVVPSQKTYTFEPYALAIPRGDEDLRLALDRALSRIYSSGQIVELYRKYFGRPSEFVLLFYSTNALPE